MKKATSERAIKAATHALTMATLECNATRMSTSVAALSAQLNALRARVDAYVEQNNNDVVFGDDDDDDDDNDVRGQSWATRRAPMQLTTFGATASDGIKIACPAVCFIVC